MKNFLKDARGFSHEMVLVAAVVVAGVGGSAFLVLSHADSCPPASGAMSGVSSPTSGCTPDSGPTSGVAAVDCTIAMSETKHLGGTVSPVLTIKNTGGSGLTNVTTTNLSFVLPDGTNKQLANVSIGRLDSGTAKAFSLGSQSVGNTAGTAKVVAMVTTSQTATASCTKQVTVTP